MESDILFSLFILILILFIFGIFLTHRFIKELKNNHQEVWKSLGSPTMFLNNSIYNNAKFFDFVVRKRYLTTDDQKLIKLGKILRTYSIFYLIIFIIFFPIYIFLIYKSSY